MIRVVAVTLLLIGALVSGVGFAGEPASIAVSHCEAMTYGR